MAALLQPRFCAYIKAVIAVRVSGGHLCEAEAATEPAGETAVRCAAIRFPPFKENTDSFAQALRMTLPFSHCKRRKVCGIPPPLSLRAPKGARQSVSLFKRIKSSCARAAQAPYFCTDRNREKNRRTPYGLGFRTFPNDQRDKLPFGNLYCTKIRYVP